MKTEIIHISQKVRFANTMQSVISFKKFVEFLQGSVHSGLKIKDPYFKWILKKFRKAPELTKTVPLEKVGQYKELLELVSTCLLALASDEGSLWALSSPLSPEIFYSTDGFYELMNFLKHPAVLDPSEGNADSESEKIMQELQYGMVLEKIYKLPYLKKTEWVRKFEDPETGLDKYFEVHIDTRFIDVRVIDQLPGLDCTAMSPASVWGEEFKKIKKILPLNRFEASGFSVISLSDVTAQQAVEQIAKLIINNIGGDSGFLFQEISHSLQTIAGSNHYQFGIVPFLTINDRAALIYENYPFSIIMQACWQSNISKKEFNTLRNDFANNPRTVIWSAGNKGTGLPKRIEDAFLHAGIDTYMMFPVFNNDRLSGIFEISTKSGHPMLSEGQLIKLKPVLPLISQLIQNLIARFNANIEDIIREKFTSIQPAVQWKFNEAAWHYLRDHVIEEKNDVVEDITFKNLYPLYGAVDIKNSTILRNEALAKDFTIQLNILVETFSALDAADNPQIERIRTTANNWLQIIREPITTQQEIRLNEFFTMDVKYEIEKMLQSGSAADDILQTYIRSVNEDSGIAYENRRRLEYEIRELNTAVNNYYEEASADLQKIFPCYFEKFRTDGVEYDIYVGQSIAPKKQFENDHLQKMKHWQLESMIKVVHLVQELNPEILFPLQTTQLLFVHPETIDITFRKDERRFDVEGAYNIRYHIIKKRIDKVTIMNNSERLTQPGKIALVYFDDRDIEDYLNYIKQLQAQNLLLNDLEELELESLQGVNGLKAIRVGVNRNQPAPDRIRTEHSTLNA